MITTLLFVLTLCTLKESARTFSIDYATFSRSLAMVSAVGSENLRSLNQSLQNSSLLTNNSSLENKKSSDTNFRLSHLAANPSSEAVIKAVNSIVNSEAEDQPAASNVSTISEVEITTFKQNVTEFIQNIIEIPTFENVTDTSIDSNAEITVDYSLIEKNKNMKNISETLSQTFLLKKEQKDENRNKSSNNIVAFSVAGASESSHLISGDVIGFSKIITNIGNTSNGWKPFNGTLFVCPKSGLYFFSFSARGSPIYEARTREQHQWRISLNVNGRKVVEIGGEDYTGSFAFNSILLPIRINEKVWLQLERGRIVEFRGTRGGTTAGYTTSFSGYKIADMSSDEITKVRGNEFESAKLNQTTTNQRDKYTEVSPTMEILQRNALNIKCERENVCDDPDEIPKEIDNVSENNEVLEERPSPSYILFPNDVKYLNFGHSTSDQDKTNESKTTLTPNKYRLRGYYYKF